MRDSISVPSAGDVRDSVEVPSFDFDDGDDGDDGSFDPRGHGDFSGIGDEVRDQVSGIRDEILSNLDD